MRGAGDRGIDGPAEHEPLLADAAGDDGNRAGREVVVVEAGVVVVRPADQPDVEVLVAQQLLVGALERIVLDVLRPEPRSGRDLGGDDEQLLVAQVLPEGPGDVLDHAKSPSRTGVSKRWGLVLKSARSSAASSTGGSATTGRSEP